MCKFCDEPKPGGDYDPCCYHGDGKCEAAYNDKGRSNCVHCGAEMFEDDHGWWHWIQEDIPYENRGLEHTQQTEREYLINKQTLK